ncbi:MAG: type II toxin-antitoxin system HicB family antitoxin [Caldilineaceae bacterium]|nr:type II toxin-antitoxin system HicB family antitoxin [Caldilineaceae bacterium]MDE0339075.1 type II toxin-antitoxin system HicB family antitoxin [Caldilineaceae bacterium]
MIAKIPLVLEPQPEGGYTVTSPLLPELITEGDTMVEALANVEDAFCAVVEIYEDRREGRGERNGEERGERNGFLSAEDAEGRGEHQGETTIERK